MRTIHLFDGQFGLERETLRVDNKGKLSQSLHPFGDDEHITRDFCENQIEIITPVCHSIREMMASLARLDRQARETLAQKQEFIWLYSNPPHFETEDDIPIALFGEDLSNKRNYRLHLQQRYGKRLMLYCGIHFNFSFSERLLAEQFEQSPIKNYAVFKNDIYLHLYKQLCRHSWLLVLLTAASPVYDKSFDTDYAEGIAFDGYASRRNSVNGYWNQFVPELDYTSVESYVKSVRNYIDKGVLLSSSELYLPIRIKPRGIHSLEALEQNGIDHIELRMFDLNPLEPFGIAQHDIEFAYLLILWLIQQEHTAFTVEQQAQAIFNHQAAALYTVDTIKIENMPIKEKALQIIENMRQYFADRTDIENYPEFDIQTVLDYEKEKLTGQRICEKVKLYIHHAYESIFENRRDTDVRTSGSVIRTTH